MAKIIKLHKGLDIRLKGKAPETLLSPKPVGEYALVPDDFVGLKPKVVVKEGDKVLAGDALFVSKNNPELRFASPVSGTVKQVARGERRKVLFVSVAPDAEQESRQFDKLDVASASAKDVVDALLQAGLFGYINQLPYAVSASPEVKPQAIFVSALRDMPLQSDFELELQGNEEAFQTGITALSRIAPVNLGIGANQKADTLTHISNAELTVYQGRCPAGNVGVQVNQNMVVGKNSLVWTVDPSAVIFFGRLFLTGQVDLTRTIAIAGSEVKVGGYMKVKVGALISDLIAGNIDTDRHVRLINGNPLTGHKAEEQFAYLGAHTSELTAIPEGDDIHELAGWAMPRFNQFSTSRTYFSWLQGGYKEYDLDARVKGGERHIIMSGEYDRVLPMDVMGEYLIKAIITGDIDRQEQLGIYEVSPEDFALCEFVDSSKLPLQQIVRQGLDTLRKENA